jgi:hypothetical protein
MTALAISRHRRRNSAGELTLTHGSGGRRRRRESGREARKKENDDPASQGKERNEVRASNQCSNLRERQPVSKQAKRKTGKAGGTIESKNHRLPSQDGTRGPNKGFRAVKPRYDIVFEQKRPVGNQTMRQQQAILLHSDESTAQHRPASACRRACPEWHLDSRSLTGTVSDGVGRPGSGGGLAWANEEARRPSPRTGRLEHPPVEVAPAPTNGLRWPDSISASSPSAASQQPGTIVTMCIGVEKGFIRSSVCGYHPIDLIIFCDSQFYMHSTSTQSGT